jgi:N-methylhydantoinase A/oxoprolinase/acetone carboxylase beta subunit
VGPRAVIRVTATSRLGVDTGGTFTDVVDAQGGVVKVLSSPTDPSRAVAESVKLAGGAAVLVHGTTVATNALLERRGGRVALVVTEGHSDVIEIARQARPSLYDPFADRPEPLVPRRLRFEIRGRLDREGRELEPIGDVVIPQEDNDIDAVAICLLHSDLNPAHERHLANTLRARGLDVTISSDVSPEFREYERTVTTVADSYLRRPCRAYLLGLTELARQVLVMTSTGGVVPLEQAAERPVALLLSGPAGGVLAGSAAALAAGFPDAITFDMGGTSTDVCLIREGRPEPAGQRTVAGFPFRMPSLDVHTIGAGGGSIARLDLGGALVVGPESAGADPGPACYGRGGLRPTVTDADLVAGRIPPAGGLAGLDRLDRAAAVQALERAGISAQGVIDVVNASMVRALRRVSVERGVDAKHLALVAFGGAGPMHACALAEALGMPAVVVPPRAGVLSAVGMLAAPRQADRVISWPHPQDHAGAERAAAAMAAELSAELEAELNADLGAELSAELNADLGAELSAELHAELHGHVGSRQPVVETALDCRYAGQSHELTVATVSGFEAEHRRRNGYARPGTPIEVVALRASARTASPVQLVDVPDPDLRSGRHVGPAVIAEPDCTIWVAEGWTARVGGGGAWVLTR